MPNHFIDKVSKKWLACYPRRTFYSLSDDLTTKNHRITITDFRPCLICQSYSQASNIILFSKVFKLELTYSTPPLLFRRWPPQSNYPLYSVFLLAYFNKKCGISHFIIIVNFIKNYFNLPHILYILLKFAIYNYSKGARGLSVYLQEFRIFTKISISLKLFLRQ